MVKLKGAHVLYPYKSPIVFQRSKKRVQQQQQQQQQCKRHHPALCNTTLQWLHFGHILRPRSPRGRHFFFFFFLSHLPGMLLLPSHLLSSPCVLPSRCACLLHLQVQWLLLSSRCACFLHLPEQWLNVGYIRRRNSPPGGAWLCFA